MSELPWAPEVLDENQADDRDSRSNQSSGEPGTLALSLDDFSSLEDRILRAVNLVKRERLARTGAEERATRAEARLREQEQLTGQVQKEIDILRAEREHVRQRVEKLLSQLDALEL
jgi:hypothetical protein